jgi:2-hydroxychromene-2-carboxylate isomerase
MGRQFGIDLWILSPFLRARAAHHPPNATPHGRPIAFKSCSASLKTGLALTLKPAFFPTNSAPSSYAIIAAQNEGGGDLAELVHGVTRAVWREEKNIAEDDVIRAALTATGFDPNLADRGLLSGAEEYAANLETAVEAGVFGAPFYVVDGATHFWGQDRLDDLALHLEGKL